MTASTAFSLPDSAHQLTLSALLRKETRSLHVAVEDAFALDDRLADRGRYAALLWALRGFYPAAEVALVDVAGWQTLSPPIDVHARRRAGLLDADLLLLGQLSVEPATAPDRPVVALTLARALGSLYVLEGSALGGRIIAGRARANLGEDLPVSFFASAGRTNLTSDWRDLRAALDDFGAGQSEVVLAEIVSQAKQSFTTLGHAVAVETAL